MLDVEPRHLDEIRRILAARAPGLEVRAFGSRAKGKPKPYSDLDLAVVGIEDRGPDALRLLRGVRGVRTAFSRGHRRLDVRLGEFPSGDRGRLPRDPIRGRVFG